MAYVIGIDLGTSSLKGILVDENGYVHTTKSESYPLITPGKGCSEQDPMEWCYAFKKVMVEILDEIPNSREELEGISFSGQMHSLVVLNDKGIPIRNAILWNDVRTSEECKNIMSEYRDEIISITKNRALEGFTLPKLLWMKKNEEELYNQISCFLLPKDFLAFYLTGVKQMEYSDASGTLMMDINSKTWSQDIIDKYDLKSSIFPKLQSSSDIVGNMRKDLCEKFNIKKEIKVFSGGADNACAALGAGILKEGVGMCSIGTSGVFLTYEDDGNKDYKGELHYFNHVNDGYFSMGVTLSAGNSLQWFLNNFSPKETFDNLLKNINKINLGSDGLLFTPYLMGERTPYFDSKIRGSFIGIDQNHTKDHFIRSVIEGITFSLKDSQTLMEKVRKQKFDKIVSVGGGSKNKDWLQIQADIFNANILTLKSEEGPALGAAMIAAVGLKWFPTFESCINKFVKYKEEITPIHKNVTKYNSLYDIYKTIYENTKSISYKIDGWNKQVD